MRPSSGAWSFMIARRAPKAESHLPAYGSASCLTNPVGPADIADEAVYPIHAAGRHYQAGPKRNILEG